MKLVRSGLLMSLMLCACAGPSVDSPSAACRQNPYYCGRAILVDDAAEAGLVPKPPPPVPTPPPPPTVTPMPAPVAPTWVGPAVAGGAGLALKDSTPPPQVDAAKRKPSKETPKRKPVRVNLPESPTVSRQPDQQGHDDDDPSCIHIATEGSGAFRGPNAPPDLMKCTYQCGDERVELKVLGNTDADCESSVQFERAARQAARQAAEKKLKEGR